MPGVQKALRDALFLKTVYEQADQEMKDITQQIMYMGGMNVDQNHLLSLRDRRDKAAEGLKVSLDKIQQSGCLVKDLEAGLIDFPTLYHGQEVYLCWKFGEKGIAFWHAVEDGFRGRKAVDDEFRKNHRAK